MTKLSQAEESAILQLLDRTRELIKLDKLEEAEKFLDEIAKYKPDDLNVAFQRGTLFAARREYDKALEQFLSVYERQPNAFENLINTAATYFKLDEYDDAIAFYKKALQVKPDDASALSVLAVCLMRHSRIDEAVDYFRQALAVSPDATFMYSDLLLAMIYAESVSPEQLSDEARAFGERIERICPERPRAPNDKTKDRKIRIGYVSPDFKDHPIMYFLEPLLRRHDKENFEIYAYSNTTTDNIIMDRIKFLVDVWRDIRKLDAEEAYKVIVEDKIDILIDVSGHTANNNLEIFALKPAPIQLTWLGYPGTSGMKNMDYRITDSYADPPGMTEHLFTETLWRLPHIFCCYQAHEDSPAVIDHPPFEDNGYITFGCFNNYIKVRDCVLVAWKKILDLVPESRLLLEIQGVGQPKFRNAVQERLKKHGIPLDRVILEPRKNANQFVLYNKLDIALDPFPCVGGTTSMDTLWMGVPLVTLAGRHFLSRMGVSILGNAGLPELVAYTVEDYVSIAVNLATDRERLKALRHNLRDKFAKSPAMDQQAYARDMEEAYRGMWHRYCDSGR